MAHACGTVLEDHREDVAELLWKQEPSTLDKLASRVCTKWARACPAKPVPASYERKDEWWVPMDEDSFKMRSMERQLNKLSQEAGSQPVKFVDPMGGMMFGSDGWDDEEEEAWMDPMSSMMGDMMTAAGADDLDLEEEEAEAPGSEPGDEL